MNDRPPTEASIFASRDFDDRSWPEVSPAANLMRWRRTYAWFRAGFETSPRTPLYLRLRGIDDAAWVYVNGTLVGTHSDWRTGALFPVAGDLVSDKNTLSICIKNTGGPGGLTGTVELYRADQSLSGTWRFRGGLAGLDETALLGQVRNWAELVQGPWGGASAPAGWPRFWRTDFGIGFPAAARATIGLRTRGLSSGSAWVNGHNLGRYSGETLLYLPECWLTSSNTLVIYDADGRSPDQVALEVIDLHARPTGWQLAP